MATMTRPKANLAVLSPKELKALESMRSIFANEPYPDQEDPNSWFQLEDWTYLRYLRARNFDLTKTEKMLRDTLEMRRTYSPHKLSADEPAMRAILNLGMWRLLPYNKLEEPVALTEVGAFDHSKLDSEEDFFRYLVLTSELACRLLMENGWKAELMMAIFDFRNFSLMRLTNPRAMKMVKTLVDVNGLNYPELLSKVVLFNAPFLFKGPYKIIRPWLPEETEKKIIFVSDMKVLDDLLHAEHRLKRHGGTKDGDEYPSIFYEKA